MLLQINHGVQLCNRLFSLTPTMAYAIHKKIKLFVLFEEKQYLDYFPNIYKSPWVKFFFRKDVNHRSSLERMTMWLSANPKKNIGAKTERALLRLMNNPKYTIDGDLRGKGRLKGLFGIDGWKHRYDLSYASEERAALLDLFMPREDIKNHVNKYFEKYSGITVGVHVRRGDYKEHLGGKWFYNDETYLKVIRDIRDQLMQKGVSSMRFLICSNEPFVLRNDETELFRMKPLFPSDCMTDLYGLSKCDYIIGPPSTFSQWASYMGNRPLNVIYREGEEIKLEDFSSIVRLDTFANGINVYNNERFHII